MDGAARSYGRLDASQISALWELQKLYKSEIGEGAPDETDRARLADAVEKEQILFYGVWQDGVLAGCCSVTVGFSTFDYRPSGVFEDFYIRPAYRHQGIARKLVRFAYGDSGVSSLTVGCADCDQKMYGALGFSVRLGNLLALE